MSEVYRWAKERLERAISRLDKDVQRAKESLATGRLDRCYDIVRAVSGSAVWHWVVNGSLHTVSQAELESPSAPAATTRSLTVTATEIDSDPDNHATFGGLRLNAGLVLRRKLTEAGFDPDRPVAYTHDVDGHAVTYAQELPEEDERNGRT